MEARVMNWGCVMTQFCLILQHLIAGAVEIHEKSPS
jgi:hypothetical protein